MPKQNCLKEIQGAHKTKLMGIINVTPDSFSGDGILSVRQNFIEKAYRLASKQWKQGADFLDIGGESTRPGASQISIKEEMQRTIPIIKTLRKKIPLPLSLDSYHVDVIHAALDEGVEIVNFIKAHQIPIKVIKLIARYDAKIVLMHMRGNPSTMQTKTQYGNLLQDVCRELENSLKKCLAHGVTKDKIIIDPGIGFAKTAEQNLMILKNISFFKKLSCPLLLGPSRKSFIGRVLGGEPHQRLMGTAAVVAHCVAENVDIVRVHDVLQMRQILDMMIAIKNS